MATFLTFFKYYQHQGDWFERISAYGQCTFESPFSNSAWYDNTKGELTFTGTTMSGWSFTIFGGSTAIRSWRCVDHVTDTYLVLRTTSTFGVTVTGVTKSVYGYVCLALTRLSDASYIYYQQHDDVATAAVTCPDSLLHVADYTVTSSDGTLTCNGTDSWDVCTDVTQMTFDYTTCTTEVMFSAGGVLTCVATVTSGGYDYITVYNQDTAITSSTNRFACISTSGRWSSVAPGNCTAFQTPTTLPLAADQTTFVGHLIYVDTYFHNATTTASTGVSTGTIVGIIIVIFIVVPFFIVATMATIALFVCARVFITLLLEYTDIADHIPVTTRPPSPPGLYLKTTYLTLTEPVKGNEFPSYKEKGVLSLKDPRYKWPERKLGNTFATVEKEKERTLKLYGKKGMVGKYFKEKTKMLSLTEPERIELPDVATTPASLSNNQLKNGSTIKPLPPIHKNENKVIITNSSPRK
ncbi:hypothetical protein MAR_022117 [Mya arenaria]|uniref:DUF7042 domain-containing protein n=1 Tax=Mya arenaria TaxID=6604 RepID=A0ABY7DMI9_MYAAR|nr:hypothetical protein MAR_022117 [Mya arenaria]